MNKRTIRVWWPIDQQWLELPTEIENVLDDYLGEPEKDHWFEIEFPTLNYRGTKGRIRMKVWFSKESYLHSPPELEVDLGVWVDAPRFRGTWCYYSPEEIERRLREALQEVKA